MADQKQSKQIANLNDVVPADQLSPMAGRNISFNPQEWEVMKGMAQVFVQSGAFPKDDNMAKVMVKMQAGRELGMQPVQSIQSMFFVHGKLGMYGQSLLSLMKKNGLKVKWKDLTAEKVTGEFWTEGNEPVTVSFGKDDQTRAKLAGDNYTKYPQDMYVARVVSRVAKLFPELIGSPVETVEVLQDIAPTEVLESPVATPDVEALPSPIDKLKTPAEKKAEKQEKKEEAKAAELPEDAAMMAIPEIAAIVEEMNIAETNDDAEGVRQLIVTKSWSVPQAQWLGDKFSKMKDRINGKEEEPEAAPAPAEAVTPQDVEDVFGGDAPAEPAPAEKVSYEVRCAELDKMKSVDLKPILEEHKIDFKGMDKAARIKAILEFEYPESKVEEAPLPQAPIQADDILPAPAATPQVAPANQAFLDKLFKAK